MIELKSKTLTEYYGKNPVKYDVKFLHYQIDLADLESLELELLEDDLENILEFVGEKYFKIYFSDLTTLGTIMNKTAIYQKYREFVYVRIRNKKDFLILRDVLKLKGVKIIIELKDLNEIMDFIDDSYEIIIQVNTVKELPIQTLDNLRKKINIRQILVGQICYLSNYFLPFLKKMANKFNINSNDYLEIEKNVLISNDFYSIEDYKKIFQELEKIIIGTGKENKEYENFKIVYEKIAKEISYNWLGLENDTLENQNLIGGLFNKTCVCEGYSKILQQALSLIDISSIVVGGNGKKEEGGHLWNQIKIEGIWYNADVSKDSILIHNQNDFECCLISDQLTYLTNYPIANECPKSFEDNLKLK